MIYENEKIGRIACAQVREKLQKILDEAGMTLDLSNPDFPPTICYKIADENLREVTVYQEIVEIKP